MSLKDRIKERITMMHVLEHCGVPMGPNNTGLCPFHEDSEPSFSIFDSDRAWKCHADADCGSGDVIAFWMKYHRLGFNEACADMADTFGVSKDKVELFPYNNPDAEVYEYAIIDGITYHEVRFRKGKRKQSLPCVWKDGVMRYGYREEPYFFNKFGAWSRVGKKTLPPEVETRILPALPFPLFEPQKVLEADLDEWVWLCEGAKDAKTAQSLGLIATTPPGGAQGMQVHHAETLKDRKVVLVMDHDKAGFSGIKKRQKLLDGVAREICVMPPLGGDYGSKYDLTDFVTDLRKEGDALDCVRQKLIKLMTQRDEAKQDSESAVLVSHEEKRVADESLSILAAELSKADPLSRIFTRAGRLVDVIPADEDLAGRPKGTPIVRETPTEHLRETLSEHVKFQKQRLANGHIVEVKPASPPIYLARALQARKNWPGLPYLNGVVECPVVVGESGDVLQTPGYHESTGILYLPSSRSFVPVPENPTAKEVRESLQTIRDVVVDFPLADERHISAWLAGLLTPVARYSFTGAVPLFLIEASRRGAGKTKLVNIVSLMLTGRYAGAVSYNPQDQAELRKLISSIIMGGSMLANLDNLNGKVGDSTLDRLLTAPVWRDRLLKTNIERDMPNHTTFFATGNNVRIGKDVGRRMVWCRLVPDDDRPDRRDPSTFRHADLDAYVLGDRHRLAPAVATLLRAWFQAGKPQARLPGRGSYEAWSGVVRACCVWLDLPDPVETAYELEDENDVRGDAERGFIEGWWKIQEDMMASRDGLTAVEFSKRIEGMEPEPDFAEAIKELLPEWKGSGALDTRHLGWVLRGLKDRRAGNLLFQKGKRTARAKRWQVVQIDDEVEF